MKTIRWIWRRQIPSAQADLWFETLAWVDPQHLMVTSRPGSSRSKVEVYGSESTELRRLLREHGGRKFTPPKTPLVAADKNRQIRVNRSLYVVGDKDTGRKVSERAAGTQTLLIPAGMAFGSGEHATTGMVLRHLGKMGASVAGASVLDLGTGSGILALAARALGAKKIVAMDNCPDCVRISRENERVNFPGARIRWQRASLDQFATAATFSLVTANLYSELLIGNATRIWSFVAPEGVLLLSGILHKQSAEVIRAFRKAGARLSLQRRRGKWMMLKFHKA